MHEAARNLRAAERFLLAPPLSATFGGSAVAVCDISATGARFRHDRPLEAGAKSLLKIAVDGRSGPVTLEAVVVWTHPDPVFEGKYLAGVRTYAPAEVLQGLLVQLQTTQRSSRIEELRSTERFFVAPSLPAQYDGTPVLIEDLSARGARIEIPAEPRRGKDSILSFSVPDSTIDVAVPAQVVWTALKSISGGERVHRAGLLVPEKAEMMRLAIGRLCELNRAALDTHSLRLKLKILRARARQLAPQYQQRELGGIPAEQYLLIQGVREELRQNPEEAMHWYRRARMIINDPATQAAAPPIASHPDALAVWEYLDRSVDPSIVSRAFEIL